MQRTQTIGLSSHPYNASAMDLLQARSGPNELITFKLLEKPSVDVATSKILLRS